MPHQWSPATSHPPFYCECYGFERAFFTLVRFLHYTPSSIFQSFPGSQKFNLNVSRASCWSSKHSPGPTICLNHSNSQKIYMSRFYLRVKIASHQTLILMENPLYVTLASKCLSLTGFEPFSPLGRRVRSLILYPFGYTVKQSLIN